MKSEAEGLFGGGTGPMSWGYIGEKSAGEKD